MKELRTEEPESGLLVRLVYMLLFTICYGVAEIVLVVVVLFQVLNVAVFKEKQQSLLQLGQSLATYIFQNIQYLTFNSEEKPFPVGEWPSN